MAKHPADSILFDLDGTLWNAAASARNAWNHALRDFHYDQLLTTAQIEAFCGLPVERMFDVYLDYIPSTEHSAVLARYKALESVEMTEHGGALYPGVRSTLDRLSAHYRLFIVSNCVEGYIENFLAFHSLQQLFTDFECAGNTGKPKTWNIDLVVTRNQLRAPVYVGDTIWDQEASAKSGVPFIFAAYGFGKANAPLYTLAAFERLPDILQPQS